MNTSPLFYSMAAGQSVTEIRIDGTIGDFGLGESTSAKRFVADLNKVKSPEIHLYLNSPGGSVMDANAIHAALQRHPAKVSVIVDGWALSAASLIAMAGDTISMGKGSMMMLHNPHTTVSGNADAMRKTADVLDKIKASMIDTYGQRLSGTPDEIAAIMDAETWYSADEAVSAGLADQVAPDFRQPAPVPAAILHQISLPAAYAAYTQEPPSEPKLEPSMSNELEAKIADLQSQLSAAQAELAAEKAQREAAESKVQAIQAAARMEAVKSLFADLGREFTDAAAQPYLDLSDGAFALLAADLRAIKPILDPALTRQQATAGQSGIDLAQLNAKLLAQVAGKKE